jgi:hypothetical protein
MGKQRAARRDNARRLYITLFLETIERNGLTGREAFEWLRIMYPQLSGGFRSYGAVRTYLWRNRDKLRPAPRDSEEFQGLFEELGGNSMGDAFGNGFRIETDDTDRQTRNDELEKFVDRTVREIKNDSTGAKLRQLVRSYGRLLS